MVATTTLTDTEIQTPFPDEYIASLVREINQLTGRHYVAVENTRIIKRWFRKPKVVKDCALYVEVPGVFNWQILMVVTNQPTLTAYLLGLINGYRCHDDLVTSFPYPVGLAEY